MEEFLSFCKHCKSLGHGIKECARLHPQLIKEPSLSRDNHIIAVCKLDLHLVNPTVDLGDRPSNGVHDNLQGNACVDLTLVDNADVVVVGLLENECMHLRTFWVERSSKPVDLGAMDIDNINSVPTDCQPPTSPTIGVIT
ncbi:uncharacterized protein LOC114580193 [Dendrobium catenatum]|uniref:uncharacterized protein LOC114580193 n=1 Tax=Dendrobium catenatum TaxID=906689 RepID=UPI00109FD36F|nr:uncharacterized protein LOC114580193 [Dendrobium catenatum]